MRFHFPFLPRRKPPIPAIAWYRPGDWERLLDMSEDRDQLEKTHEQWVAHANRVLRKLEHEGLRPRKVVLDLDDLAEYCVRHGLSVNGSSRAKFAAVVASREDAGE